MSADLLRRAASLMRERAEAATYVYAEHTPKAGQPVPWFDATDAYCFDDNDGPHIMAWSPAVALAVADWLESVADDHDRRLANVNEYLAERNSGPVESCRILDEPLNVARAYLGEQS